MEQLEDYFTLSTCYKCGKKVLVRNASVDNTCVDCISEDAKKNRNKRKKNGLKKEKLSCDCCKNNIRKPRWFKGECLCWNCYRKRVNIIRANLGQNALSLDAALNKTYEIKGYLKMSKDGKAQVISKVSMPSILIGHKVKLVLVK